jgi:hypothetical protein
MFDPSKCYLDLWCGKRTKPANYRIRGSPYECMKTGYGRGYWEAKREEIDDQDLYQIPYMTEHIREHLNGLGIGTVNELLDYIRSFRDYTRTKTLLERDFGLSPSKYNHVVLFLFKNGIPITKLPECKN